jgi:hypothetical protein
MDAHKKLMVERNRDTHTVQVLVTVKVKAPTAEHALALAKQEVDMGLRQMENPDRETIGIRSFTVNKVVLVPKSELEPITPHAFDTLFPGAS